MALGSSYSNENTLYLKVNKDGLLYLSAKEPTEGYAEIELKDGRKTYHKTFGWVSGTLKAVKTYNATFNGAKVLNLAIIMEDEDITYFISTPMTTQNGQLNPYVISIACIAENLVLGQEYILSCNKKKEEKNGGMYIKYPKFYIAVPNKGDDKNELVALVHYMGKEGDIPQMEEKTVAGVKKWDTEKRDNYLWASLETQLTRLKGDTAPAASASSEAPSKEESTDTSPNEVKPSAETPSKEDKKNASKTPHVEADINEDDLPF